MKLVHPVNGNDVCVVIYGPFDCPYFIDGCGSAYDKALEFTNPDEWAQTFSAYVICNMTKGGEYEVVPVHSVREWEGGSLEGYIPFDQATSKLRVINGLLKLSEDWYGK